MSRLGFIVVGTLWLAACDPFHADFADVEPAELYRAPDAVASTDDPSTLRVMSWNIAYASGRIRFFWQCDGERGTMSVAEVEDRLAGIAAKINQVDPDLVLLQEVDVESKRTAYVDEVRYLVRHTRLGFAAYASQWRADFVPSDGVGKVDSGNVVLSRWPIRDAERLALPLISDEAAITRYFYLKRNILRARIALPGAPLWVVATHTEAFSSDGTKRKHIDRLAEVMSERAATGALVLGGGDLNEVPPNATERAGFVDNCTTDRYGGDDYSGEEDWLDPLYGAFEPAIPLADIAADEAHSFSFGADEHLGWTRKLDYLFTSGSFVPGSGLVHQSAAQGGMDTLLLSDHAPLVVTLERTP